MYLIILNNKSSFDGYDTSITRKVVDNYGLFVVFLNQKFDTTNMQWVHVLERASWFINPFVNPINPLPPKRTNNNKLVPKI